MRCPCLDCPYRYEDKYCSRCIHCEARIDYARQCDSENMLPALMDAPGLEESMSDIRRDDEIVEQDVYPLYARETIERICDEYRVDTEILMAGSRDRKAMLLTRMVLARKAAVKALRLLGMEKKEIGKFLNISYPAVCKHLRDDGGQPRETNPQPAW